MKQFYQFAGKRPILFDLLLLLLWLITTGIVAGLLSLVLKTPVIDPVPQTIGTLFATAILLFIFWRFGWLDPAGVTHLSSGRGWLVAMMALTYLIIVYWYAFFGEISFNLAGFIQSEEARSILWRQIVVGFVEEILFRGVLLYGSSEPGVKPNGELWRVSYSSLSFSASCIYSRLLAPVRCNRPWLCHWRALYQPFGGGLLSHYGRAFGQRLSCMPSPTRPCLSSS